MGSKWRWSLLAAGCVCLGALGCGGSQESFTPVTGKVAYKGKPLETGSVVFSADTSRGNTTAHEPRGAIDSTGNYTLSTAGKPGAPPGWYRVGVIATKAASGKNPYAVPTSLIPKQYSDPQKSGLSIEVVDKPAAGAYDLELK
jgi:hypothetical protein